MARALVIEEERGTCSGRQHPHNGYYAGDFTNLPLAPAGPVTGIAVVTRPVL